MNNREMVFYFDESFHDRKLTFKNHTFNAFLDTSSDLYTFASIGTYTDMNDDLISKYSAIEAKIKENLNMLEDKELKATTFKKKNFTYGIASFNPHCLDLYLNLFKLLNESNILFQIGMISKTELIVTRLFKMISVPLFVNAEILIYTITKFLVLHKHMDTFAAFFLNEKSANMVIKHLKELVSTSIRVKKDHKRTVDEVDRLNELLETLDRITIKNGKINKDWNYNIQFEALILYTNEFTKLNKINLIIDREQSSYDSANKYKFLSINQADSFIDIGIRIVDMFVTFFGRLAKSTQIAFEEQVIHTLDDLNNIDYSEKRYFSAKWFDLNANQFECYKLLGSLISRQYKSYWAFFSLNYRDHMIVIQCLINYIAMYDTLECFNKDYKYHTERMNSLMCIEMNKFFKSL